MLTQDLHPDSTGDEGYRLLEAEEPLFIFPCLFGFAHV